jgi:peptidoglycan/LPS O-acetylase OafA/YrhL
MSALIYKIRPYSWLIYLGVALLIFGFTPLVRLQPDYFPAGAPTLLQNMIQGPDTGFSIFPWTGFKNKNVYKYLIVMGLVFYMIGWAMTFIYNGDFTHFHYKYLWAFDRAFFVAILLILFTYLSGFERFRPKLFMAVGQETFAIYVIHAIILYGAIVGYSLRSFLENKLSALEAILGAILFLAFFIGLVQVLEPIRHFFRNFRTFFISNGKPSKP